MKSALVIGHIYTDVTFVSDYIPQGDEKYIGEDYSFGVGGNAAIAGFTLAKFSKSQGRGQGSSKKSSLQVDMMVQIANDRLSDVILERCSKLGIKVIPRKVKRSSLSLVLPNDNKRAIVRCRDDKYITPFPLDINIQDYQVFHTDGHQPEASLHYAKLARKAGVLTSLDGGSVRNNTEELIKYIDIAIVSERFCEQLKKTPEETVEYLLEQGVKVAGVTLGELGMIFAEGDYAKLERVPAVEVAKDKVVDSTGAGDIFHGAYLYAYLEKSTTAWRKNFEFASRASALSVQVLGAEAGIPKLEEVLSFVKQ